MEDKQEIIIPSENEQSDFLKKLESIGVDIKEYLALSEEEKEVVNKVIKEVGGIETPEEVTTYETLYSEDYDEIPVDFMTFLTSDYYIGKATRNGDFLYPFWKEEAQRILLRTDINEIALSGSIGIGKSTFATIMMAYHLYKTMCLKDPQAYFNLSPGSKIVYILLNNTLSSSQGGGFDNLQKWIIDSPWFLKHGKVVGREHPVYIPDKGFELLVGSRVQHTLGRHIICVTGDTVIYTSEGEFKIEDLEDKQIQVFCYNEETEQVELSEPCYVRHTGFADELIEITLEDDSIVKCTLDHKLLIKDKGYVEARYLTETDEIVSIN